MNEDLDLSFPALAPDGGASTLAYWLGPCDVAAIVDIDASGIAQGMAYQYDIEEQAGRTGILVPADVERHHHAVEPDILGKQPAGCAWTSPRLDDPAPATASSPDPRRFHQLLATAVMRAIDRGRGLLVVAKPGWSNDHHADVSAETARLMRAAGFVVQNRHA